MVRGAGGRFLRCWWMSASLHSFTSQAASFLHSHSVSLEGSAARLRLLGWPNCGLWQYSAFVLMQSACQWYLRFESCIFYAWNKRSTGRVLIWRLGWSWLRLWLFAGSCSYELFSLFWCGISHLKFVQALWYALYNLSTVSQGFRALKLSNYVLFSLKKN